MVQVNDVFTGFILRDGSALFLTRDVLDPSWAVEDTTVDLTDVCDKANIQSGDD